MFSRRADTMTIGELKRIVAPIAKKNRVTHVSLFGSRARGDYREDSDYDFLIATEPGTSLLDLGCFAYDLEEALGKPVNFAYESTISDMFYNVIKDDLREIYG